MRSNIVPFPTRRSPRHPQTQAQVSDQLKAALHDLDMDMETYGEDLDLLESIMEESRKEIESLLKLLQHPCCCTLARVREVEDAWNILQEMKTHKTG